MSFEENKEDIAMQEPENVTFSGAEENSPEQVTTEELPKEKETSPFKKIETWIILAIFVIPAIWFVSKQFKKDAPQQVAATQQQADVAAQIAILEQKATSEPTYDNLLALGIAYENNGRIGQAIMTLNKALTLDPKSAVVYNNLGYAKILARDYDNAILDLEKAIQLDSTVQLSKNNLAWAKKEKENLIKTIQKKEATPEKDRDAQFYVFLALDYQVLKQYEKAIEYNKKALSIDAKNILAYNNLGVAYMFEHQYDNAIVSFQKAIDLDGSFQLAKNNLKWAQDEKAASAKK